MYLNKLPERIDPSAHVLVSDPMLATGACLRRAHRDISSSCDGGAGSASESRCCARLVTHAALRPRRTTGGTIGLVLEELVRRGASVNMIRLVGIVAAPPALKMLSEKYPGAQPSCANSFSNGREATVAYRGGCPVHRRAARVRFDD